MAKGIDPGVLKQAEKTARLATVEHRFGKLANAILEQGVREGRAVATQTKHLWLLDMEKADFGAMAIVDIKASMLLACLRKVKAKGNYETAQRRLPRSAPCSGSRSPVA